MHITTLTALRQLYGPARERSLKKEIPSLDVHAVQFIGLSPFVVLASSDADGHMDASPRGGGAGFRQGAGRADAAGARCAGQQPAGHAGEHRCHEPLGHFVHGAGL
ncbi:pyridoxamine 5'-phosphate oxidase family protein [Limnohabitans sp. Hippo3]|uniref:pyridoxamine 5'-phosphate oxidase family protein n=1 Tax=Limnohabitans sp. Hippo3 TaxID=1597956 RepID=UPI003517148D